MRQSSLLTIVVVPIFPFRVSIPLLSQTILSFLLPVNPLAWSAREGSPLLGLGRGTFRSESLRILHLEILVKLLLRSCSFLVVLADFAPVELGPAGRTLRSKVAAGIWSEVGSGDAAPGIL